MKKIFISLFLILTTTFSFSQVQKVVGIGDSLFAGFVSGGLMVDYQKNSIPALVAKQLKISDFEQPLVSYPGIPALLELKSLNPLLIAPISEEHGLPTNLTLPRPYDNLAVPGATLYDCLNKKNDEGMHGLVLRGLGTQVEQAISLNPDLILIWIGNNDVLGAAVSGTAIPGVTITPKETFENLYAQLLGLIKSNTSAKIILANIPDVTAIPFVTTIPPYIINPSTGLPVYDENGNLIPYLGQSDTGSPFISLESFVLLTAKEYISQGYGIPSALGGKGEPLPDFTVLTPNETALIKDYLNYFNNVIFAEGESKGIPVLDIFNLFNEVKEEGISIAGMEFTADFLSGGLFSYDGVHLNSFGYAYLANQFIEKLNQFYGLEIPLVALKSFIFETTPDIVYFSQESFSIEGWEKWISLIIGKNFLWERKKIQ